MTTTQQILDQLNTYEFDHTPETENIWQDVIADPTWTTRPPRPPTRQGIGPLRPHRYREFRWERSYERGRRWLDDSPAITAEIVDVNDIVVVDDREYPSTRSRFGAATSFSPQSVSSRRRTRPLRRCCGLSSAT